jgi:hypothetical protein
LSSRQALLAYDQSEGGLTPGWLAGEARSWNAGQGKDQGGVFCRIKAPIADDGGARASQRRCGTRCGEHGEHKRHANHARLRFACGSVRPVGSRAAAGVSFSRNLHGNLQNTLSVGCSNESPTVVVERLSRTLGNGNVKSCVGHFGVFTGPKRWSLGEMPLLKCLRSGLRLLGSRSSASCSN